MTKDELQARIERLHKKQTIYMKIQNVWAVLTILSTLFSVEASTLILFIGAVFLILFGAVFSAKASSLARKRYPNAIVSYMAHASFVGKSAGWDPYVEREAAQLGDNITAETLKFNRRSLTIFLITLVSYIICLIVFQPLRSYWVSLLA